MKRYFLTDALDDFVGAADRVKVYLAQTCLPNPSMNLSFVRIEDGPDRENGFSVR